MHLRAMRSNVGRGGHRLPPLLLALPVMCLPLTGCLGGAELAMLGAAANAASSTEAAAKRGRINAAHRASFGEVKAAAEWAVVDLGLEIDRVSKDSEEHYRIHAKGTGDVFVTVLVQYETDKLTMSQVSAGLFGHLPTARLVLQQMRVALGEIDPARQRIGRETIPAPAPAANAESIPAADPPVADPHDDADDHDEDDHDADDEDAEALPR